MGRVPLCCFFPNEPLDNMVIRSMKTSNICFQRMKPDICMILYYTNQDIISEEWKPILSLKGLESFDIFRLVVVYIFHIVDFFFLSESYSVLSFSSFLENNIFLIWTREFTIVPVAVHLEMVFSVGVGGLKRQRKHQEEVKERIHNKSFHFVSSNQGM